MVVCERKSSRVGEAEALSSHSKVTGSPPCTYLTNTFVPRIKCQRVTANNERKKVPNYFVYPSGGGHEIWGIRVSASLAPCVRF